MVAFRPSPLLAPSRFGCNAVAVMDDALIAGKRIAARVLPLLQPERQALSTRFCRRDVTSALAALLDSYDRLAQNTRDAIDRSGLVPACQQGCGWCCHGVKVNVTALEALIIANHLQGDAALQADVRAAAARRSNLSSDELFVSGEPCPFLGHSQECRVYEVRPIACRRHCCMDAAECERAIKNPTQKLPVSQHSAALAVGALAGLALIAALEDAHLDCREFELTSAVAVALGKGVAELWVAGDRVFDAAERPIDALDRQVAEVEIQSRTR